MPRQTGPFVYARTKDAYNGPDSGRVREQLFKMQEWAADVRSGYGQELFAANFFWILRKNPEKGERNILTGRWNDRLIPFRFNNIQRDITAKLQKRNIFLKPRQGGYTTWMIIMRLLMPALIDPGVGCLLISQNNAYATAHFSMLHRAYRYFGWGNPFDPSDPANAWARDLHRNLLHVRYSSRKELIFDQLDSRIVCASAEVEEVGQGLTIQHLGCTEVARWEGNPEETLANVKESVPSSGTIDLESTANMMGGYFYEECMRARRGDSEFTFHFHPWYFHEEYEFEGSTVEEASYSEEEKQVVKGAIAQYEITLRPGHIAWRRFKKLSLRHNFAEKYPEDPITCFLLQGNAYFDTEILGYRLRELEGVTNVLQRGRKIKLYVKPKPHRRYVVGVDPMGGVSITGSQEDLDYASMQVQDLETGEQCATYHDRIPPEDLGEDAVELCKMFNNALCAVERTGDGRTVLYVMQTVHGYMNIYKHRPIEKRDWSRAGTKGAMAGQKLRPIEGFPTTAQTRPILLNRVGVLIRETPHLIHDIETVRECLTFVRNETGKPEAAPGNHDDHVLALGICNYARLDALGYMDPSLHETYDQERDEAE